MRIRNWKLVSRRLLLCAMGLTSLGLCSCAKTWRSATADPLRSRGANMRMAIDKSQAAPGPMRRATANPSDVQSVRTPGASGASYGTIEPISYERFADDAHPPAGFAPGPGGFPPGVCPPGMPGAMIAPGGMMAFPVPPAAAAPLIAPATGPELFPDEYLCDGGDRGFPIHYTQFHRMGLETEDAVAEYVDDRGAFHVKPTNRVCIYAPRFAAVRTISSPVSGVSVEQLASAQDLTRGVGVRNRLSSGLHLQNSPPVGVRVRSRASGMEAEAVGVGVHQRTRLALHAKLANAYEDISFFRTGQFLRTEAAWLAYRIQAAAVWTRVQSPYIVAQVEGAQEVRAAFIPQELVGVEDKQTPGELRIVKLADKKVASPGEIITFTLRYDNLGDRELHHIRIVDNLTPRLEYIEGTATSDRPGELAIEDNDEGSVVLKFVLDDPLPGHTGGVVTFQTRVR